MNLRIANCELQLRRLVAQLMFAGACVAVEQLQAQPSKSSAGDPMCRQLCRCRRAIRVGSVVIAFRQLVKLEKCKTISQAPQ